MSPSDGRETRITSLPPLTYLSFDPVSDGVGASQVLPYVERLAGRGVDVRLHTFERSPSATVAGRLKAAGVTWERHRFGSGGGIGGLTRVARGAAVARGAELAHARAHLAGAAAALGRCRHWVWDVRSLWTEQRIDMGLLTRGSASERVLRRLERRAACASGAVVTLSAATIPALEARTGCAVSPKASVISTCVDLDRFAPAPFPDAGPVRLLLSGTLNALYDVPAMIGLAERLAALRPTVLEWAGPAGSPWDGELSAAGVHRDHLRFEDMPVRVASSHAGLSMLRSSGPGSVAAAPTKLAEFLACGRPVVVSPGLGDFPALLARFGCGVVVGDTGAQGLERAARELSDLLEDSELPSRCRAMAEQHFDLDRAVDALIEIYSAMLGLRPA